jgi:hypothetical protein
MQDHHHEIGLTGYQHSSMTSIIKVILVVMDPIRVKNKTFDPGQD